MEMTPKEALATVRWCGADPSGWCSAMFGVKFWDKQVEILEAVRDEKEVAVASCNHAGKDFVGAHAALWFTSAHDESITVTTAPTDRQVGAVLWNEMNQALARATANGTPIGGRSLQQELHLGEGKEWSAIGFTAPAHDADKFQGLHRPGGVFLLVDEANGISKFLFERAFPGVLTGQNSRMLAIGNPDNPLSAFAKMFEDPAVKKIHISAFDTPNLAAFGITEQDIAEKTWRDKVQGRPLPWPQLLDPEWVERNYHRWGPKSPLTMSRIWGRFPIDSEHSLIPLSWIEAGLERSNPPKAGTKIKGIACDVAREGDDVNVGLFRHGYQIRVLWQLHGLWTTETTGRIIYERKRVGGLVSAIDADGLGDGVCDQLIDLHGEPVVRVKGSASPRDGDRFRNRRAELFWLLREHLDPEGDPDTRLDLDEGCAEILEELSVIKWKITSGGLIQIESKDEIKKPDRLGHSPDVADAHAYAMAIEAPSGFGWY